VSAITSLADDLALALAAKSIRVEAPVPGRPYVGIELPNDNTELVTLHSVLTSEAFKKIKSDLAVALGRDVSGNAVAADLSRMPHALIAGATGSGKSVCVNTIIASLLFNLRPEQLQLLMIDPKMVELMPYNGIPHLIAPVVTDMERVVGALTWALREMERRYKLFSQVGKRNHESYNKWAVQQGKEELPYIVIIIDELADLMMVAPDDVEQIICRIAQMARATGMHLILATQRPSVDVVTGLIKANVPTRISFAVASSTDSRVILDQTGSENLLGRGDMLYQASDSGKLQRLQGGFVSDQELHALVSHWMRYSPSRQPTQSTESPWDDIVEELAQEEEPQDQLLPQAIEIVREHQWASTSFLQRKLRIGYTRAARLIDALEEKGFIGPPKEGGNGSREVLVEPLE
jgi:S-DNA-T family DNA segregation ATPase FtsK/SpoIIIE